MPNSRPTRSTRSSHLISFLAVMLVLSSSLPAQAPSPKARNITGSGVIGPGLVGPVLTRWAWGYGDTRLTLKETFSADGMVAAADLYALDRPPSISPGGPLPSYDLILGRHDTLVISVEGCIEVDGAWQPFADHAKILVAGVAETRTLTGTHLGANGTLVPEFGPVALPTVVNRELLVRDAPPSSGQLQIGYDAAGKPAGYTKGGTGPGTIPDQPSGQNGCMRRAVVWIAILHDVNTARAEVTSNWNDNHIGNQAFDTFARGFDFNSFDVSPVFFGQLPAASGDSAAFKTSPKLRAETSCGGFPLDSTLEYGQKFGFLQPPDGYQDIFGRLPAYTPPLWVQQASFATTFFIPLSFFDLNKTPALQTWSSPFPLNDHFQWALLQMLIRDVSFNAREGVFGGARYADSETEFRSMIETRVTKDLVDDVLNGRFAKVVAEVKGALGIGFFPEPTNLPIDDGPLSLDDWKTPKAKMAVSVSGLLIDLTQLTAIQNSEDFKKSSNGRKLMLVQPMLDKYFPLLQQRWHFDRFHSTDIIQAGTVEKYHDYLDAVAKYSAQMEAYHNANSDCDGTNIGTHMIQSGPHAGRMVTCPQPPLAPDFVPKTDSLERFPATDCRTSPIDTDQSELCSLGHMFFAQGSGADGRVNGFSGHVNFGQATYFGQLRYDNHAPPLKTPEDQDGYDDDDVDWNLETPLGEGASGGQDHLHVEHSAWSTLRKFRDARRDLISYCEDSRGNPSACDKPASIPIVPPPDFWQVLLDHIDADWSQRKSLESAPDVGTAIAQLSGTKWDPSKEDLKRAHACDSIPLTARPFVMSDRETNDWVSKNFLLKGRPAQLTTWTVDDDCAFKEGDTALQPTVTTPAIVMGELSLDCYHGCTPELHPAYMLALRLASRLQQDRWAFFVNRGPVDEGLCSRKDHYAVVPDNVTFFVPHPGALSAEASRSVIGTWVPSRDKLKDRGNPLIDDGTESHNPDFRRQLIDVELVPGQGALVHLKMPSNLGKDGKGIMKFVEGEIVIAWNGGTGTMQVSAAIGAPTWETETTATAALVLDPPLLRKLEALHRTDAAAHARVMRAATTELAKAHIVVHNPPSVKLPIARSDDLLAAAERARARLALPLTAAGPAASVAVQSPTTLPRVATVQLLVCRQLGPGACVP